MTPPLAQAMSQRFLADGPRRSRDHGTEFGSAKVGSVALDGNSR
jgi:hypothetical protein